MNLIYWEWFQNHQVSNLVHNSRRGEVRFQPPPPPFFFFVVAVIMSPYHDLLLIQGIRRWRIPRRFPARCFFWVNVLLATRRQLQTKIERLPVP